MNDWADAFASIYLSPHIIHSAAQINEANKEPKKPKKKERVDDALVRHAAGKTWIDNSLADWDKGSNDLAFAIPFPAVAL